MTAYRDRRRFEEACEAVNRSRPKSARTKPYTEIGIRRVPCARCGQPSVHQWQICVDNRVYRGLCVECDIDLNAMVMRWIWGDSREADIAAYRQRAIGKTS